MASEFCMKYEAGQFSKVQSTIFVIQRMKIWSGINSKSLLKSIKTLSKLISYKN